MTRLVDRGLRLLTILTLVGGTLLQGGGVQTVLAAGADNLASATVLSVPLVNDLTNTTGATSQAGEFGTCGNFPPSPPTDNVHSVWYKYTPGSNGFLSLDTLGSNYDTVLEVYTTTVGSPTFANLTSVGCNDDVGAVKQSELTLPVSTAYTYYIVARDYNTGAGGTLDFSASFSTQQQIYVNKTTGSDTNPGSAALPVKSIRCGVKDPSASPCNVSFFTGAVVNISAGSYAENVSIDKSLTLTASSPVTATSFTLTNGAVVSGSSGVHAPTINVNQLGTAGALIQDGVLLASAGGTVNVATGTYTETVTINKNLTLQGSGGPILTQPVGTALTITGGTVTVNDFNIQNSTIGVSVTGGSGHVLFHNNFTGNTTGVSSSGPTVTATLNYWGSSTGPTHSSNPGGTGNVVSNNVVFSPWCTVPAPTCTPLAGIATKLVFTAQPSDEVMNVSISPAIVVKAQDAAGNIGINFNGPVTMTIGVNPGGGALAGTNPVVAVNGVVTFTDLSINAPGIGYTLIATANLPAGITSTQSITFTIFNNPPNAVDDNLIVLEDTSNNPLDVLANDIDDDTMLIVAVGPVANGTRIFSSSMITYTPNPNFFGTEVFTYTITDQFQSGTDTAVVTVTVTNVNDPPIAVNDAFTVTEDSLNNPLNVLANDIFAPDPPETFTITAVGTPPNGVVVFSASMITYTPNLNFNGVEVFTYTMTDGGFSSTATITVTVTPVNDPVTAVNDTDTTNEDTPKTISVLTNDHAANVDGVTEPLTVTVVGAPGSGTASIGGGGANVIYTPTLNFNGTDVFTYTVSDGTFSATGIVTVTVIAINDAPNATNNTASTSEDTAVGINVTTDDTDVDGTINSVSLSVISGPSNGSVITNTSGVITYTPNLNFNGVDIFTYQVCDTGTPLPAMCDTALVTVTVTAVNDPPIITDNTPTTNEDTPIGINVIGNDNDTADGSSINGATLDILGGPSNGVVVTNTNGIITYTPNLNFNGTDVFTYSVCDSGIPLPALCGSAVVTVTINAINDPPNATNNTASTSEDTAVGINVTVDDTDVDGTVNSASLSVVSGPSNGTVITNTSGVITYTPNLNFNGVDVFTYQVCDTGMPLPPACDTGLVTVTVSAVNDPALAVDDTATVTENSGPNTILVLTNDDAANPDPGEILTVTVVIQPANGIVANFGNFVRYAPNTNFVGTDVFTYTITDGTFTDSAVVTVTVVAAPTATPTNTPVPSDTPTNTPVVSNTPTNTPVASNTPTNTPVASNTPTNTPVGPGPNKVYLPLVLNNPAGDLIGSFSLSPVPSGAGQAVLITAVITNQGTIATGPFWVDFYINPSSAPTAANTPWNNVCGMTPCYGIAWYISSSLAPGQSLTLVSLSGGPCSTTSGTAGHYCDVDTMWPGSFASGTQDLYLFVDSWNPGVATGAVDEGDESNNRSEFHFGSSLAGMSNFDFSGPARSPESLPTRPAPPG